LTEVHPPTATAKYDADPFSGLGWIASEKNLHSQRSSPGKLHCHRLACVNVGEHRRKVYSLDLLPKQYNLQTTMVEVASIRVVLAVVVAVVIIAMTFGWCCRR
jgi:hypothetical protein